MSDWVYWDTSALLKIYATEADSAAYLSLLTSQPNRIAVSFLHRAEIYFGLNGKEARGEITRGAAKSQYQSFEAHIESKRFWEIPWGGDVVTEAHLALDKNLQATPPVWLRTLDGLHLGAMVAGKVSKLVTADIRMQEAALKLGMTCVEP
ncbi:MAG: type II toxin-antitoxin system VapC family toxin [Verrucomicrobiota bacterium]